MKVNLKNLSKQKHELMYAQTILSHNEVTRPLVNNLGNIIQLLDEIEIDLTLSGESIVELDKGRLKAIKERNKMLNIIKNNI